WLAGWHAERVEGELAVGRSIRLGWDSLGIAIDLDVVALDPPARLVLRGSPPGRPPQTLTVELTGAEGGGTALAIRHDGFLPGAAEERAGTAAGWRTSARVLDHYLARHAGRARVCAAALAPVAASLDDIGPLFARPVWLAGEIALGVEGSPFAFRLDGGRPLAGRVLASALPRQIALAVEDTAGVLVLRAIQLDPRAALVGALAWSWAPDRPAHADLVAALEPAVARLVASLAGPAGGAA
ncbi:MAG TPA: SRPBCC domain-containing protein, partial [Kofleriaceae bacterium]|nr:SRPBCC domain-containing protein [Kofleriaceae bacterium]